MNTQMFDTALAASEKIAQVLEASYTCFFERNDASLALATALCAGEHMIMFGKPGTTKTALGRFYGDSLGVNFFYQQLNGATQEEALFGPISMKGLDNDVWTRKWAALAKAHIAFLDEAGKASNLVQNLVLGAMQERVVSTADDICYLPLHTMLSGSNETIDENPAFWDRWTIRVLANQIQDIDNFAKMLVGDTEPHPVEFDPNHFPILRQVCAHMAKIAEQSVIAKMVQIKTEMGNVSNHYISDRRWKSVLRVAAGHALLRGGTEIDVLDLHTAKWLLWEDPDHVSRIYEHIEKITNEDLLQFKTFTLLVDELEQKVKGLNKDSDTKTQAILLHEAETLDKKTKGKTDDKWKALRKRIQSCSASITDLIDIDV